MVGSLGISFDWVLGFAVIHFLVARRHPDPIVERAKFMGHKEIKPWDNLLVRMVGLSGGVIPVVAGLDVRFGWPGRDFGRVETLIALVLVLFGFGFGS